ncbi:MAG: PilZ domain-containing protein [Candidatus Acidiferrum sp.]
MPSSDAVNRRRSERVMLQIRVTVLAETPERAQVQEDTHTLVVNAHGGLMKLKLDLQVGQPIILVNPQTGIEQSCRVVRIDQPSADYFAVAFEFDRPSPKFWPVTFPPSDWELPKSG